MADVEAAQIRFGICGTGVGHETVLAASVGDQAVPAQPELRRGSDVIEKQATGGHADHPAGREHIYAEGGGIGIDQGIGSAALINA